MESVRSLFIPVVGGNLLVPNAAIAEIIQYTEPDGSGDHPWMLGYLNWRDREVPLISYEVANGGELPLPKSSMRIAVLKSLTSNDDMPYLAILTQRIPRLATIYEESIELLDDEAELPDYGLQSVLANGEPAIVPDLPKLEALVHSAI